MTTSFASFQDYTFDLRERLREAANSHLRELEASIVRDGFEWLEGYLDNIESQGSRGNIADLIKTPSRTQTAKKTRAITTAAKDRSTKIKDLNSRLGLSPLSKTTESRQPFSPLLPRALNIGSPASASPLGEKPPKSRKNKGKGKEKEKAASKSSKQSSLTSISAVQAPDAATSTSKKTKGKRERSKKTDNQSNPSADRSTEWAQPVQDSKSAPARLGTTKSDASQEVPEEEKDEPNPEEEEEEEEVEEEEEEVEEKEEEVEKPTKKSRSAPSRLRSKTISTEFASNSKSSDTKQVEEAEEETRFENGVVSKKHNSSSVTVVPSTLEAVVNVRSRSPSLDLPQNESVMLGDSIIGNDLDGEKKEKEDDDEVVAVFDSQSTRSAPSSQSALASSGSKGNTFTTAEPGLNASSSCSITATTSNSAPITQPAPPSAPSGPPVAVRQVRSSWLSKALGTGTIPITGLSNANSEINGGSSSTIYRKSYAPATLGAASSRPSTALEYGALRKSLVPSGTLKRKSEVVLNEDGDEDENDGFRKDQKRPEKVSKPTQVATNSSAAQPSRRSIFNPPPRSTGVDVTTITRPESQQTHSSAQSQSSSSDRKRTDIHKVTKALEEMRERAAAKQKTANLAQSQSGLASNNNVAGTAAPSRPAPTQLATSTGTGFLRGIGNIGAGLGRSLGLVKNDEEEAARLQKEMEEDKRAQEEAEAELARLMKEMEEEQERDEHERDQTQQPVVLVSSNETITVPTPKQAASTTVPPIVQQQAVEREQKDEPIDEDEENEVNESIQLPDLPVPELDDDPDAEGPDHNIASALCLAGVDIDFPTSTTPTNTPPRLDKKENQIEAPPQIHARVEKHVQPEPNTVKPAHQQQQSVSLATKDGKLGPAIKTNAHLVDRHDGDIAMVADDEEQDQLHQDDVEEVLARIPSTSSSGAGLLSQAHMIAAKTLGIKPTTAPVKSVQQANAALKKEQSAAERKMQLDKLNEQRRQDAAKRKMEEEKAKQEEEKRIKLAEEAERKRRVAENIQRKKERDERMARNHRERALREEKEREIAASKAKAAAEEEAAKKRKLAASTSSMLNKSGTTNPLKKPTLSTAPSGTTLSQSIKGKEPFRPVPTNTKPLNLSTGPHPSTSSSRVLNNSMGPSTFRTATTVEVQQSTIISVNNNNNNVGQNGERRPLGPPTRPSAMNNNFQAQGQGVKPSNVAGQGGQQASAVVLQQSRIALQHQLDDKANEAASEDIVLPDIASEYSNSDDESDEDDFKRPAWAESPELRHALEQQAYVNPDELFGPIRPLNMEELFKARAGKFRARTSSGNWHSGDGLTKAEEREYARRMGFRPIQPSALGQGSSGSTGAGGSSQGR